jgi:hypothetical protein
MKPAKIIKLIQGVLKIHSHRLYLGESNESESWLQYASIAFNCDPEKLRKDLMTK